MLKAFLVARREYFAYISAWGFWVGLFLTPVALILGITLPSLIQSSIPVRYYAVIESGTEFSTELDAYMMERRDEQIVDLIREQASLLPQVDEADAIAAYEMARSAGIRVEDAVPAALPEAAKNKIADDDFVRVPPPADTLEGLIPYLTGQRLISGPDGERALFAAFIVEEDSVAYWSEDVVNDTLSNRGRRALERIARQQVFAEAGVSDDILDQVLARVLPLNERSPSAISQTGEVSFTDRAPYLIAMGFSFMLWLLIFSVVNYLLTGTIEERSNKIFDALLTSVSLPQLLSGKLLGVLMLSVTLISVWSLSAGTMALLARDAIPGDMLQGLKGVADPRLLIPTLISFVLGYLMFGSMFLALGSLCDTIQEAQSLLSPVIIIMMVPLLLLPVSLTNPDSSILAGLAWVPLLAPFLIILRVPNDPPLWELLAQIGWMAIFTILVLWAASRIYRAGAVDGAGLTDVRRWIAGLFGRKPRAALTK